MLETYGSLRLAADAASAFVRLLEQRNGAFGKDRDICLGISLRSLKLLMLELLLQLFIAVFAHLLCVLPIYALLWRSQYSQVEF